MKKLILLFTLIATSGFAHGIEYVINHCPVTPVREEPTHAAEQATQLLFGEICEVLDHHSSWTKIRSTIDGQIGWVSPKMLMPISHEEVEHHQQAYAMGVVATPMALTIATATGEQLMLTIGTRLPYYKKGTFEVLGKKYKIDPRCVYSLENGEVNGKKVTGEDIVNVAKSLLNVSYLWGGKNTMGYDCSGFTQTVYSVFGINLLRNAREQVTQGLTVGSLEEAQPGDLVFFDHSDRNPEAIKITHVGILISPTEVIHCAGCVHVNKIDEMGIRLANGKLTHHLVKIKRHVK